MAAFDTRSSQQQVLDFLENELDCEKEVIEKFRTEKVDREALALLPESHLADMGITALGDRIKLLAFSRQDKARQEKMKQLKECVEQGKSARLPRKKNLVTAPKNKKKPKDTLKVDFKWKHYCLEKNVYQVKREAEGGGTRSDLLPRNSTAKQWMTAAKKIFFPGGESSMGKLSDMFFRLTNFKGDDIDMWGELTIDQYKETNHLHTLRFTLITEDNTIFSSGEEDDMATSPFDDSDVNSTSQSTTKKRKREADTIDVGYEEHPTSGLLGTTTERNAIREEQDKAYNESLRVDYEKEERRQRENERVKDLRSKRKDRVRPEPSKGDPHTVVIIRHLTIGMLRRSFAIDAKLQEVYDWVGSLDESPEHFTLATITPTVCIHYPDEDVSVVESTSLYMEKKETPIALSRNEQEVAFYDGTESERSKDDTITINDNDVVEVPQSPPPQLLTDDKQSSNDINNDKLFLEDKWKKAKESLLDRESICVSRHNCFNELMELYEGKDIDSYLIPMMFTGEYAVGDGIRQEVYSVFWEHFFMTYCEGVSQFTLVITPLLDEKQYQKLGRILTHQFIQTGTLPVQLAEASLQKMVCGNVSDACLIESFTMLLPGTEREIIKEALQDTKPVDYVFPCMDVTDILSGYDVTTRPTLSNIKQLVLTVARTELLSRPFICLLQMREGMGPFWDDVKSEHINAVYKSCIPTPSNVVDNIYLSDMDVTQQKEKVFRWLVTYIKNQDELLLSRLLRYCTGSDMVTRKVVVQLEVMPEAAIRPKAQTCFGVLKLAANIRTYAQLKANLDFYLHNPNVWDLDD